MAQLATSVKKRVLGANKLEASLLGLGCMGLSECYGETNDAESIKTIHRAFALGVTHFDTADCYGMGHNEELLGKAVKNLRNNIVLSSKCGMVRGRATGEFLSVNGNPKYIKQCCEESLRRLQTDHLDLYYLHRADPKIPIEESIGAFTELIAEGKILHIGLSEVCANTLSRAHKVYPLTAIQSEYSLWCREPEQEIIPLCQSLNIGFVAHGPLGKGFLTGAINTLDVLADDDLRRILPRFQHENITHNLTIITILKKFAKNKACTPAQIALAWVLAQNDNIVSIPGTKHIVHLEENLNSLQFNLSQEELLQLSNSIPLGFAQGDLLPESFAKFSNN